MNDGALGRDLVLERSGSRIHYRLAGPEGRPLVVLTHGAALDRRAFAPQVEALSGRYRVLSWDLPGHGRSQPIGRSFSIRRAADDLLGILDAIDGRRVILVGQSMGGDVSQEFVFRHPDRAAALVLVGCLRITEPRGLAGELFARLAPLKLRVAPLGRFREQVARAVTVRPEVAAYVREAMAALSRANLVATWSAIARGVHAEPGYRVPCPLMLAVGEQDTLGGGALSREAEAWAAREPDAVLVRVPEAGHVTTLDNPAFLNERLLRFLRERVG